MFVRTNKLTQTHWLLRILFACNKNKPRQKPLSLMISFVYSKSWTMQKSVFPLDKTTGGVSKRIEVHVRPNWGTTTAILGSRVVLFWPPRLVCPSWAHHQTSEAYPPKERKLDAFMTCTGFTKLLLSLFLIPCGASNHFARFNHELVSRNELPLQHLTPWAS